MNNIIPIFYSESSLKSINVWWPEKECKEDGPTSIVTMAKQAGLKEVCFVSNKFTDYMSAYKLCNENNLQLIFGLELWICANPEDHSEDSVKDESKVIVWQKNSEGYKDIIKLYSKIYTNINNKYYKFRGSWKILKEMWTENLILSLPFFDNFFHRNLLNYGSSIVPDFPVNPILFNEINSGILFAPLVKNSINLFNKDNNCDIINTKTIYYPKYKDAKAWLTYRTIHERSTFDNPSLDFLSSNNFCLEDYINISKI